MAHDGVKLLPALVRALNAQTYPIERTVGVDTASRDRSGAMLAELIGQDAVFGMTRSTGFGDAVATALRHATRASGTTEPGASRAETRVEWIWLLHDDCEPAPDALELLLRGAARDRKAVVVGPKVLDGQDRRTLREAGIAIDRAGRRVTGIDPGEIDQGQHDHKRAVMAVSSAGMLVRRDVWDRLGGFDPNLKLFRDDLDFCWRVHAAGLRVHVITDAVLYHWELAGRRRRDAQDGSVRVTDRRNALYVLAVNLPWYALLPVLGGCILGSLVRACYFLLTKQLDLAAAFGLSVLGLFAHPLRVLAARRRRAAGLAEGYAAVRMFIPPAQTLTKLAERTAGLIGNGPPQASGGRHQAAAEESEEDAQFIEQPSAVRRVVRHPGVQLFLALVVIALVAERRLLGANLLGGGALVPAWGGAGALWREYLAGFHAVSVGSTASAPPYLGIVAMLAAVLGWQAWLAVDVLLLGCVPLAGLTAYLASRWVVTSTRARMLLAASYALLPVATGAVAAGRLGTATAFILLPLIAVSAGRMLTAAPRQAHRAAWATGLLIAVASAFAPLTWVFGVVFALGALAGRRWLVSVRPLNAAIVAVTPFFVLFPWSLHLLTSPSAFGSEAGLSPAGLTTHGLEPTALLALSPGGPGVPPVWVTTGLALALAALVLPTRRLALAIAGWAVAITGLLAAVLLSRVSVTPSEGGAPADGWPGVALALAALGLLVAAAPAAQWLVSLLHNGLSFQAGRRQSVVRGGRRVLAVATLAAAASAPLLVAAYWVTDGIRGPVGTVSTPLLPAFVSASSASGEQYRTLILRPDGAGLDYTVVRGADPALGEPELGIAPEAEAALSRQVAALGAPDEADAGDPGLVLGSFGIRWVLLPAPVDSELAQRLDGDLGLTALNNSPSYDIWQVTGQVGRVRVVSPSGATTVLPSGAVNLSGVTAPAGGGTLLLAEPHGGWTATLNGHPLTPLATPVNGWAQGFTLPPGGGQLSITRNDLARPVSLIAELVATLAVIVLALPGKRTDPVEEAEALEALREARDNAAGRRAAGRLRVGGIGHRAANGKERFGRRLRRGQTAADSVPPDSPALGTPLPAAPDAEAVAPDRVEAGATAGRAGRRHDRAQGRHRGGAGDTSPGGVGTADIGPGDTDSDVQGGGTGGHAVPPWDVTGDWASPGPARATGPQRSGPRHTGPQGTGPQGTGEQPADPQRFAPERPATESVRWGADSLNMTGDPATAARQLNDEDWLEELIRGGSVTPSRDPAGSDSSRWGGEHLNLPDVPAADAGWRDDPGRSTDRYPTMRQAPEPDSAGRAAGPPDAPDPLPDPEREPGARSKTSGWRGAIARLTGAQPAIPQTPGAMPPGSESTAREQSRPQSPALGTPTAERAATESRPPWETGPQRPPWEHDPSASRAASSSAEPGAADGPSGPREAAESAWRTDAESAWGSGAPRALPPSGQTGGQPASRSGAHPAHRRRAKPAAETTAQPTFTPTGPQPRFTPTGPQPTFTPTGAHPTFPPSAPQPTFTPAEAPPGSPSGTAPGQRGPWEADDWVATSDAEAGRASRDVSPAAGDARDGDQAAPAASAEPESDQRSSGKPERHSHRGGRHGKPNRRRGLGNRSSGDSEDGES